MPIFLNPLGDNAAMVKLDEHLVTVAEPTITFAGISQQYRDLRLKISGRTLGVVGTSDQVSVRFNQDTSLAYTAEQIFGFGGVLGAVAPTNDDNLLLAVLPNSAPTVPAGRHAMAEMMIFDYTSNTFEEKATMTHGFILSPASNYLFVLGGLWRNSAPMNRMDIFNGSGSNYKPGTIASLYGII